jgi:hypothetical protein
MQQEHRIILTTLHCSFGSWAPAQVTAPCGADNPRARSHLTRRGVPPSVVALAAPRRAPPRPPSGLNAHPPSGADAAGTSPAGATSSPSKTCRALGMSATDRSVGASARAATPSHSVDGSQPGASGAGPGTGAMSWQVTALVARGRGRGEGTARSGERCGPCRGTRARCRSAQRDEFHPCDVGAPRFGTVFPSAPCGRAPGTTPE